MNFIELVVRIDAVNYYNFPFSWIKIPVLSTRWKIRCTLGTQKKYRNTCLTCLVFVVAMEEQYYSTFIIWDFGKAIQVMTIIRTDLKDMTTKA